jgi:hypothetical protein
VAQDAHVRLCKGAGLLGAPALTHTPQDRQDPRASPGFIPPLRHACGASPFLLTRALRAMRGPLIRPMPGRDLARRQAGLRLVGQASARCGQSRLRRRAQRLEAALALRQGGRPAAPRPGLASGPGLGWPCLPPVRPRMPPAPPPPGPGPQRGAGFEAPWRPSRRDGHRRLESTLAQRPHHLQPPLSALTLGRREGSAALPPIDTEAPDPAPASFPPPAASGCIDGVHTEGRHGSATAGAGAKRLLRLAQGRGQSTDRAFGAPARAQGLRPCRCHGPWRQPAANHRHAPGLERGTRLGQIGPHVRARRFVSPPPWRHRDAEDACGGLPRLGFRPMALARACAVACGALTAQALCWFAFYGLWAPARGRPWDQGTPELLTTVGGGVALEPCRDGLCVRLTWDSPLGHTGGSCFLRVKHLSHASLPSEGPLVRPPLFQEV